jgi:hypothetical protein
MEKQLKFNLFELKFYEILEKKEETILIFWFSMNYWNNWSFDCAKLG